MHPDVKTYWIKQAEMHEKKAITFQAKWNKTREPRWLKQATSNANSAAAIRANYDK